MPRRVVFLDRDGVLNRTFPEDGTTRPPMAVNELEILPGVSESLNRLHEAGFLLIVVTNQPDVARGKQSREAVEAINAKLCVELPLHDVFTCFHDNADKCSCRKPRPGMLMAAAQKWDLDMASAILIGDRWSDIVAAHAAGCMGVLVETPFSGTHRCQPDHRATDISDAVAWILTDRQSAARTAA